MRKNVRTLNPKTKHLPEPVCFVESVRVDREPRLHWKTAILTVFWILIAIKSLLAHWAVAHWQMPFHAAWIWAPTLFAALVCTVVFLAGGKED